MRPAAQNMNRLPVNIDSINQTMLDVDSAGIEAFQITDKMFRCLDV